MRWFINLLILAVVLYGAYYAYSRFSAPSMPPAGAMGGMGAPPVSVAEVLQREVEIWQDFSGRIVAVEHAEIRPQVSGTIDKIHFAEGEKVEKGQLLFTIDQRPYLAALQAAQAQYKLAESEFGRAETLLADNAISQREGDQRKNALDVARANLTRAQVDYGYTQIKAPVAGRASRAEITVGNVVSAGGNAPLLTTIVSDNPVYADFDMDERAFLSYVRSVGNDMEKVKALPVYLGLADEKDAPHVGLVQSFDNQLNAMSGTLRVRTIFDNDEGKLVPGMFARIRLGSASDGPVLLVNETAIGTDQNKRFVFVVGDDNTAQYREVTLGGTADGMRVVSSGLSPGERIIVNGLQRVRPGVPVTPEIVPMDAPIAPPQAPQETPSAP